MHHLRCMKANFPAVYAVHPAYYGQADQLCTNPVEAAQLMQQELQVYRGPAFAASLLAFKEGDVYQINEREYYSFADGIRYFLTDTGKRIAILSMKGVLYADSGYSRYDQLAAQVKAAAHPAYAGLLIEADSPGGAVRKMDKLAKAIEEYEKPIGVWVSGMLCSAAAYVTAGADVILTDSTERNTLGSIGVFSIQMNYSKKYEEEGIDARIFRNEGAIDKYKPNSFEEWTEDDIAYFQAQVDQDAERFHNQMSAVRGMKPEQLDQVKTGKAFTDEEALSLGLIDGRSTREEAITKVATFQNALFI